MVRRRLAWRWTRTRRSRCVRSSLSRSEPPRRSSSGPRMSVRGVLSSCDTDEKKLLLARSSLMSSSARCRSCSAARTANRPMATCRATRLKKTSMSCVKLLIELMPNTTTADGIVWPTSTKIGMTTAWRTGYVHPCVRSSDSASGPRSSTRMRSRLRHASSNGQAHCGSARAPFADGVVDDEAEEGAGEPATAAPGDRPAAASRRSRMSSMVAVLPVPVEVDADEVDWRDVGCVMSTSASWIRNGWSSGMPVEPRLVSLMTVRVLRSYPSRTSLRDGLFVTSSTVKSWTKGRSYGLDAKTLSADVEKSASGGRAISEGLELVHRERDGTHPRQSSPSSSSGRGRAPLRVGELPRPLRSTWVRDGVSARRRGPSERKWDALDREVVDAEDVALVVVERRVRERVVCAARGEGARQRAGPARGGERRGQREGRTHRSPR